MFPLAIDSERPSLADELSLQWRELCKAVGVPNDVRLHDDRGLLVDFLENAGVPDNVVSHVQHHTADMKSTTAKRVYSTNTFRTEKLRALRLWQLRVVNIVSGKRLHALRWHG